MFGVSAAADGMISGQRDVVVSSGAVLVLYFTCSKGSAPYRMNATAGLPQPRVVESIIVDPAVLAGAFFVTLAGSANDLGSTVITANCADAAGFIASAKFMYTIDQRGETILLGDLMKFIDLMD